MSRYCHLSALSVIMIAVAAVARGMSPGWYVFDRCWNMCVCVIDDIWKDIGSKCSRWDLDLGYTRLSCRKYWECIVLNGVFFLFLCLSSSSSSPLLTPTLVAGVMRSSASVCVSVCLSVRMITQRRIRGAGSPGQGGSTDPLKFEIGVKKLIPRLCRTGDFWPWPPCWKMVPARLPSPRNIGGKGTSGHSRHYCTSHPVQHAQYNNTRCIRLITFVYLW